MEFWIKQTYISILKIGIEPRKVIIIKSSIVGDEPKVYISPLKVFNEYYIQEFINEHIK